MKTYLALFLLVACGDNIHPPVDAGKPDAPDESFDYTDVAAEVDTAVDAAVPTPDAACDKHVEINDHEHKCQHDQK